MPALSIALFVALSASGQKGEVRPGLATQASAAKSCQSSAGFRPHEEQEALRLLFDARKFGLLEARLAALRVASADRYCSDRPLLLGFDALIDSAASEGKHYDAWVAKYPKSAFAYTARAAHRDARADVERGGAYFSDTPPGRIAAMRRLNAKAAMDFRQALSLDPTLSLPAVGLIRQARHEGGVEQAAREFSPLFPGSYAVRAMAISALSPLWGGTPEQMTRLSIVTASAVKSSPDLAMLKPYAACNIAAEKSRRGDAAEADRMLAEAFGGARAPGDPSCWSLRSRIERSRKHYADASSSLAAYQEAIGYVRRSDVAGDILLLQRRYGEALVVFDRGIRFDHGSPDLYCGRGNVLRGLNRLPEARAAVQRGLAVDPSDAYCKRALVRIEAKEAAGG